MSQAAPPPTRWRAVGEARISSWAQRRLPGILGLLAVAMVGAGIGAALSPAASTTVGPLETQVRVLPSLHPGIRLLLPPAGEVDFHTHNTPVAVLARVTAVDPEGARTLIDSPAALRELSDTAAHRLIAVTVRAAVLTVCCALAGALALGLLVYRRAWRRIAAIGGLVLAVMVGTLGLTGLTADPERLAQPRFTGLLSQAPYIAGRVPNVLARLESYRSGLADIIRSVSAVYATADQLPQLSVGSGNDVVTVLHVSDIHLNPLAFDLIDRLVQQFGVDVVIDTGDITTWGTEVESRTLGRIAGVKVPYVFVRGNHDSAATARAVAANRNAIVLDGRVATVAGLTIAGAADPVFTPDPSDAPAATLPVGPTGPDASGSAAPAVSDAQLLQLASHQGLANLVDAWDAAHPAKPVQIAAVHEPVQLDPLYATHVPLIFAGHTHQRASWVSGGTRVLVEGSTGGAGITSSGLRRLSHGQPLPLAASLVYIARTGPYAGHVLAVDAITVGGFGLTSISLERTVVDPIPAGSAGSGSPATPSSAPPPEPPGPAASQSNLARPATTETVGPHH